MCAIFAKLRRSSRSRPEAFRVHFACSLKAKNDSSRFQEKINAERTAGITKKQLFL